MDGVNMIIQLADDGSIFVPGIPGCGKTFTLMNIFDEDEYCAVFINPKGKQFSKGPYTLKLDDNALRSFEKTGKIVVNTNEYAHVAEIIQYFEENWNMTKDGKVRIYIDETDYFADFETARGMDNKVVEGFTKLRNDGILFVAMCQSVKGQISAIVRKTCHQRLFFRLDEGEYRQAKIDYGLPFNCKMFEFFNYHLGELYHVKPSGKFPKITWTANKIGENESDEKKDKDNNG
jgi:broad-specificity NMP kinase